ncbi:MAG TPA: chemotaxis protein CheA [Blastocatellia bacterium]|nr:chemotaxis protein CheA [Blastocatellia bacterium]
MDDFSREEMEQLFAVFRDQSLHILDEMCEDLLAVESGSADGEALARLRRAAHTIKGDSACVGLEGVTEIAHRIEDVFELFDREGGRCEAGVVDTVLAGLDLVRGAISGDDVKDVPAQSVADWSNQFIDAGVLEGGAAAGDSAAAEAETAGLAATAATNVSKRKREYVRVEATKVDALLNLAGEMVIARSVINQVGDELEREFPRNDLVSRFGFANSQMGKLIGELQKSVLKMRMVTIDQVFRRFARPVRELAGEGGKRVDLEMAGGETELDRALVDLLYEPILHLLRNAVDHGIETEVERRAVGKPDVCKIVMRAYHECNQVVVEVVDDGRGIDIARLKEKAIEVGAISNAEAEGMSDDEALNLIFLQGCTTAREVTRISGRGVGAAAVKSAIEQLRGSVTVKSERGVGTTFTLRLPLTLAIIKALLFTANGELFAFPLLSVSEIVRADASDVVCLDGHESYRLRDRFISLVRPAVVLGLERRSVASSGARLRAEAAHLFIVVLSAGERRYGVVADTLLGDQELVIKPLESHWVKNEALAGASVLGDGRVVLILDAEMIFRKAIKYERSRGNGKGAYAG